MRNESGYCQKNRKKLFLSFRLYAFPLSKGHRVVCRSSPRASTAASLLMGTVNFNMSKWDLVPSAP